MAATYDLSDYVQDLRQIVAGETDAAKITELVVPLAKRLALNPRWRDPQYLECNAKQGFRAHLLHEEPNHDLAVFLFSWLPGRGTTPHDHKTWAVVVGIEGQEQEIGYARLDDGARPGHAELKRAEERVMTAGEASRCYPDDIHTVRNVGASISMSLHTYGRHINYTGRSEFNLEKMQVKPYVIQVTD